MPLATSGGHNRRRRDGDFCDPCSSQSSRFVTRNIGISSTTRSVAGSVLWFIQISLLHLSAPGSCQLRYPGIQPCVKAAIHLGNQSWDRHIDMTSVYHFALRWGWAWEPYWLGHTVPPASYPLTESPGNEVRVHIWVRCSRDVEAKGEALSWHAPEEAHRSSRGTC